ncbi:hypothetical protein QUF63_01910, partial [Anaerolineales bacterium HSG25]|nr:hypothetical protein [Anaerolineales bacterium HSG25]
RMLLAGIHILHTNGCPITTFGHDIWEVYFLGVTLRQFQLLKPPKLIKFSMSFRMLLAGIHILHTNGCPITTFGHDIWEVYFLGVT